MKTSYNVRIWRIREHVGKDRGTGRPRSTYRVRWSVDGQEFGETYQTRGLAESRLSKFVTAQREGVAFDTVTGVPEPMARQMNSRSWYDHAIEFVDIKWPHSAAGHRRSIAESLAAVTVALLSSTRGAPSAAEIRRALYGWSFNKTRRDEGPPPEELAAAVRWVRANTVSLVQMDDAALIRKALDTLSVRQDGKAAAATTVARRRGIFYGALRYAVELRRLPTNPIDHVRWTAPRSNDEIDRRSVVNPVQAIDLLSAVCDRNPRLAAFFACMYFSALRPAEVIHLRIHDCILPENGWGILNLTGSTRHSGLQWGDDPAAVLEDRELKHRAKNEVRSVPAPPPLVRALRWHLAAFGCAADGRLFVMPSPGNRPVSRWSYTHAWRRAREAALTEVQRRTPLAARPYDLRHAAVSLWLNAGVPATQVAEWAGHSVHVLLKVYAKCIDGEEETARRRIATALGLTGTDDA